MLVTPNTIQRFVLTFLLHATCRTLCLVRIFRPTLRFQDDHSHYSSLASHNYVCIMQKLGFYAKFSEIKIQNKFMLVVTIHTYSTVHLHWFTNIHCFENTSFNGYNWSLFTPGNNTLERKIKSTRFSLRSDSAKPVNVHFVKGCTWWPSTWQMHPDLSITMFLSAP